MKPYAQEYEALKVLSDTSERMMVDIFCTVIEEPD
jgi:hypothetical protein